MNKQLLFTRGGEFEYSAPAIDTVDVRIEKGFAESDPVNYGPEGDAGGEPGFNDGGDF